MKLKSEFHNSKLESINKNPEKWISNLKRLQVHMSEFGLEGNITNEDFMIHVLHNLPVEYNMILDGLENCHTSSRDDTLTIEVIYAKLNHQY